MAEDKAEEEYELIPVSPMRRLEKRLEMLESSGTSGIEGKDFFKELVSIVRMNQQLVDELANANDALRIELAKLPPKLDNLIGDLDELISFIKATAAEETGATGAAAAPETLKPLLEKMDKMIEGNKKIVETTQSVIESVEGMEHRLKPPLKPLLKRPLLPMR